MTQPCREDPDAWFISRDGKQYSDDEYLTPADAAEALASGNILRLPILEDEAKKAALIRRRQSRDACYTCPLRLPCLTLALEGEHRSGTWGGYFEEQIKEIRTLRDERAAKRGE